MCAALTRDLRKQYASHKCCNYAGATKFVRYCFTNVSITCYLRTHFGNYFQFRSVFGFARTRVFVILNSNASASRKCTILPLSLTCVLEPERTMRRRLSTYESLPIKIVRDTNRARVMETTGVTERKSFSRFVRGH